MLLKFSKSQVHSRHSIACRVLSLWSSCPKLDYLLFNCKIFIFLGDILCDVDSKWAHIPFKTEIQRAYLANKILFCKLVNWIYLTETKVEIRRCLLSLVMTQSFILIFSALSFKPLLSHVRVTAVNSYLTSHIYFLYSYIIVYSTLEVSAIRSLLLSIE